MSTVLAFGFFPGGGFALRTHNSFNPAIPHHFIHRTYCYTDYSLKAIALAAKENWPSLAAATVGPRFPQKVASAATTLSIHQPT
ncbi:hypothetical protein ACLOJK_022408 [Asimina triloba]